MGRLLDVQVSNALHKAGLVRLLDRLHLRAAASTTWKTLRSPNRILHPLLLARDRHVFQRRYPFLAHSPPTDPARRVLVVSLTDGQYKAKEESILAKTLQLRGYTPLILTGRRCRHAQAYHRLFGFDRFVWYEDFFPREVSQAIREEAAAFLGGPLTVQALKTFQYRGVNVGRQVLSSITRTLFQGRVELDDPLVRDHLARLLPQTMQGVLAAEALLDTVQPEILLCHEKGYASEGPVFEVALNRGLNCIYWCHPYKEDCLIFRRYTRETKTLQAFSLSRESWETVRWMPWTEARERDMMQEFRDRYEELRWFLARRLQDGKVLKAREEVQRQLGLDPRKKTAVIFSHLTWDASFFHGEDLFEDYEEWLLEAVRAACANPALNWVVKLHPATQYRLRAEGITGELSERLTLREHVGVLPRHVTVLGPDIDINTFSLFTLTDYCLTVRGTIGIEMACFGIPVLTAGTGRYAGLGFTVDSTDRTEYLARLARLQELPRLSAEQTELAKKHAYALFKLRPAWFKTFRTVFRHGENPTHPLFWDLEIAARSFREIVEADDLRAFANWAINSRQEDFLLPWPGQDAAATDGLRALAAT